MCSILEDSNLQQSVPAEAEATSNADARRTTSVAACRDEHIFSSLYKHLIDNT